MLANTLLRSKFAKSSPILQWIMSIISQSGDSWYFSTQPFYITQGAAHIHPGCLAGLKRPRVRANWVWMTQSHWPVHPMGFMSLASTTVTVTTMLDGCKDITYDHSGEISSKNCLNFKRGFKAALLFLAQNAKLMPENCIWINNTRLIKLRYL